MKTKNEPRNNKRKGQMGIMEYILMTFFIMVVIVIIIVFLTGWQVSQLRVEEQKTQTDTVLSAMKNSLSSEFLVKEESVFDDSKLLALIGLPCSEIESILGNNVFLEIEAFAPEVIECRAGTYDPNCNKWSLCVIPTGKYEAFVMPVNIHRKLGITLTNGILPRTDLGAVKVGVYYET